MVLWIFPSEKWCFNEDTCILDIFSFINFNCTSLTGICIFINNRLNVLHNVLIAFKDWKKFCLFCLTKDKLIFCCDRSHLILISSIRLNDVSRRCLYEEMWWPITHCFPASNQASALLITWKQVKKVLRLANIGNAYLS